MKLSNLLKFLTVTALFLSVGGCSNVFTYKGNQYKLQTAHGQYLQTVESEMEKAEKQWDASGKSPLEKKQAECSELKGYTANAPVKKDVDLVLFEIDNSGDPDSARAILELDQQAVCREAEELEAIERKKQSDERAAQKAEEERLKAEEQRLLAEYRSKLQETVLPIKNLSCSVVDFTNFGKRMEDSNGFGTTASGIYVGALVKCVNNGKKTTNLSGDDFLLIDSKDRSFNLDEDGLYRYIMSFKDDETQAPVYVELHPGLKVYIITVFDVPPGVPIGKELYLSIKNVRFPLVFP